MNNLNHSTRKQMKNKTINDYQPTATQLKAWIALAKVEIKEWIKFQKSLEKDLETKKKK